MHSKSLLLVFALLAACSDKTKSRATADSELARDLALASTQTQQQPTFQDTSVAPAPEKVAVAKEKPPAPAPARARASEKSVVHAPKPVPPPQKPAQSPAPTEVVAQAPASAPAVVPAPAAAPAHAEIGSGTGFALTSGGKVCTSSLPGDKLVATLNSDVTGSNGAVIPAGSSVVLEVASVNNGQNGDNAQINFRVRSIVVGDKTYTVAADVTPLGTMQRTKVENPDQNADKKKVIGGAIIGGILGQVIGHNTKGTIIGAAAGAATGAAAAKMGEKYEACMPAGSPIRLTLNQPLVMS
jgi:YmgG-like glycine-zipper protein